MSMIKVSLSQLLLQDHLTMLTVSHVDTSRQSTVRKLLYDSLNSTVLS